jgi:mannonate dehydratase
VRQAWRWYGPDDPVTLDHVRQAGATEIVSALHQYAPGEVWPQKAVAERKRLIEDAPAGRAPLKWTIVESIPVPDDIQRGGEGAARQTEIWIENMRAVAAEGIRTICYNVMPVVDWTRTDLDYPMPTGATALRFDYDRFAAFDLHVLERKGADADYDEATRARARKVADCLSQSEAELLTKNISAGLPGATTFSANLDAFRDRIASYRGITPDTMRANVAAFLARVTPVAEELGVRLTLHPDDPPRPIFGLPRIASTRADYEALFKAVPSRANGICFCVGSLGSRTDNDVVQRRISGRVSTSRICARRRSTMTARASASPSPIISTATSTWSRCCVRCSPRTGRVKPRGKFRFGRITATACSTTSRRRASTPATPGSDG